jgi:preprotein translocase subunit SecE
MKAAMLENLKESPDHVVGWFGRAKRFLSDVRAELGRVTWPTRREVWATTIVVILTSMLFGVYLYTIDISLSTFFKWAYTRLAG